MGNSEGFGRYTQHSLYFKGVRPDLECQHRLGKRSKRLCGNHASVCADGGNRCNKHRAEWEAENHKDPDSQ